jgi:hypothetical protein
LLRALGEVPRYIGGTRYQTFKPFPLTHYADISDLDSSPILGIARDKSSKWLMNYEFWVMGADMTAQIPKEFRFSLTLLE